MAVKALFVCILHYHLNALDQGGTPLCWSPRTPSIHWGIICQDWSRGLEVTSRQPKGVKLGNSKIANYNSSWILVTASEMVCYVKFSQKSIMGQLRGMPDRHRYPINYIWKFRWEWRQDLNFSNVLDLSGWGWEVFQTAPYRKNGHRWAISPKTRVFFCNSKS